MTAHGPAGTVALMPADDELRRRAEEVRELARALRSELRTAKWEAKQAARRARHEWRSYYRTGQWGNQWQWQQPRPPFRGGGPGWWTGWGPPAGGPNGNGGPSQGTAPGGTAVREAPPPPPVWSPPRPPKPPKEPKPKRPPIRHRRDGSTLISLLLVTVGLAWLASATHVVDVSFEMVLAVTLTILGAVMVITARTDWSLSRRSWPVWLGAAMLVMLLVTANGPQIGDGLATLHFGPVRSTPVAWADAGTTLTNFAGPIQIDLTALRGPGDAAGAKDETLRARATFGPINVTVPSSPQGYRIRIRGRTVFGPFNVPSSSIGQDHGPVLTLDLRGAFGPVNVSPNATAKPAP